MKAIKLAYPKLFPAYAGVIPATVWVATDVNSLPRIRGGDPSFAILLHILKASSPHTRG